MRLIDADNLLRYKVQGEIGNLSGDFVPGFQIDREPTVDAEPVRRGRWVTSPSNRDYAYCSECMDMYIRTDMLAENNLNYCSNCGAKMDAEVET